MNIIEFFVDNQYVCFMWVVQKFINQMFQFTVCIFIIFPFYPNSQFYQIDQQIQMNRQIKILAKPNALIPKTYHRERKSQLKSTPIKDLKERTLLLLPQFAQLNTQKNHRPSPHKSITNKFKTTNDNITRYRISFLNLKNQQILISPQRAKSELVNEASTNSTSTSTNAVNNGKRLSNLLKKNKVKSLSQTSISIAYEHKLMGNSQFKYPNQAVRQFLRMTTIRQLFESIERPEKNKQNKLKQKQPNFPVFSRKIQLPCDQYDKQDKHEGRGQNYKSQPTLQSIPCEHNQNKKPRFKISIPHNLKIKPSQIISTRIDRHNKSQFVSGMLKYAESLRNSNKRSEQQGQIINGWQSYESRQQAQDFMDTLKQEQFLQIESSQQKIQYNKSIKNSFKPQMTEVYTQCNSPGQENSCFVTKINTKD